MFLRNDVPGTSCQFQELVILHISFKIKISGIDQFFRSLHTPLFLLALLYLSLTYAIFNLYRLCHPELSNFLIFLFQYFHLCSPVVFLSYCIIFILCSDAQKKDQVYVAGCGIRSVASDRPLCSTVAHLSTSAFSTINTATSESITLTCTNFDASFKAEFQILLLNVSLYLFYRLQLAPVMFKKM